MKDEKKSREEKGKQIMAFLGFILVLLLFCGFLLNISIEKALYNRFEDRGLPRINIVLNGVDIQEINGESKEIKYGDNVLDVYDKNKIVRYDDIEIKGRGNGTWTQRKKPYQIKFKDKVNLFGLGKAKKWVLLADAMDATHLRNETAFYLAEMLNMKYCFEGKFIELYVDGNYEGLYYVTHAVEIGKHTVDLKNQLGILVELDNFYGVMEENYKTNNGDLLVIKDLVAKDNKNNAIEDFLNNYNEFEIAVKEKNYRKIEEIIDVESFAQYYLLSEFSVNPDAYWTSFYMYKDGVEDTIHAGPSWDFDLAFGNREWETWMGEKFYSPTETMVRRGELLPKEYYEQENNENGYETSLLLSTIVFDLMDIPEFREVVENLYRERMSGRGTELITMIEDRTKMVEEAKEANDKRWKIKENDDLLNMLEWIRLRYAYFEQEYGNDSIDNV
ncbi:CotH kinase family protein [Candidatus Saccharibacteria bacterium]|nr:CotH kinase family protein [Candidatus Saccharibacteria bacterium]